ncbi:hypothetical protein [methanotrophic endosymbiont of Bathymodiolus puteoserpentis (Logatchev)]|jgi:hypothetical protein|uniref:hypothetical protein n=1 Tax=methanotrophic endosymbiont of Bathymodiolus puteoserpentis (Logatchev) TaxID=343235 RepID=UPI0013C943C1|nr:hypothetical protein [methanotrophic endosymbiont of Bathymodiolus puteoserpentis (Logatchev)]SHE19445.1 hypothetical protein BPUTEOMOX_1162 [methanotrophic endosymbiont of Bathymodiolus puteoserpentis (Logatchev)]
MQQIEICHYWREMELGDIDHLAADTILSPEIVKFLSTNVMLPEVRLEQIKEPRLVSKELDDYELAMIA